MANRLASETSPYLLQHANNPVDWYPWGEEALGKSRREDKPILLSIGYSACHWCHVMAHESFENPEIAAMMNDLFVNIKVDREERPDLDNVYMTSVQLLTGQGGWPMTVFLTPDGKPFYGGTYFPPSDRGGMPGFPRVLQGVSEAYRERRAAVEDSAGKLVDHIEAQFSASLSPTPLKPEIISNAFEKLERQFDAEHGGFGGAPKFPSPMTVEFLLQAHHRFGDERSLTMAEATLDQMARGGLYDQVGGGFHRYTVDAIWLVPHFEKMLYDNAQLAHVYALAYQATGEPFYRAIAEETLDYVLREMTAPEGGFYSAQDADTEGEEGLFYVWTLTELREALGEDDAASVAAMLGVTERGNFEGSNVLSILDRDDRMTWRDERRSGLRQRMYDVRERRSRPGRDDKVLTSWNGMMLRAFAVAARVFDSERYADAARTNAAFIRDNLYRDGHLLHSFKDGEARVNGFLEDYACLVDGLLELYQATFERVWIDWAVALSETMLEEFYDPGTGAFYDTGASGESLITRPRDAMDNAIPSGNSVACHALLRLSHLTGHARQREIAVGVLEGYATLAGEHALGFSRLLCAADLAIGPSAEVAIVRPDGMATSTAMFDALRERYLPRVVVASGSRGEEYGAVTLLAERGTPEGVATAYVCVNHACQMPTTEPEHMIWQIEAALEREALPGNE